MHKFAVVPMSDFENGDVAHMLSLDGGSPHPTTGESESKVCKFKIGYAPL